MVNENISKYGLVETGQINKLLQELQRRREEDDLISGLTDNTNRHEVIKAYNTLKKERRSKKKLSIVNFLNKSEDMRKRVNDDVYDVDDIAEGGETANIDDTLSTRTPVINRGTKAQYQGLISKFFVDHGINKRNMRINGKNFDFTYFDLVNDLTSDRKVLNLHESEIRSILPELKRKGMPVSYIKNKKIKRWYYNTLPTLTVTSSSNTPTTSTPTLQRQLPTPPSKTILPIINKYITPPSSFIRRKSLK